MKIFIYTLLAIVTALLLTLYLDLAEDPGYLLLAWRNYTFETSLFALAVAVIVIAVVSRLLYLLFSCFNPWHLIRYGRRFREARRNKSRSRTTEGLLHFSRSNWTGAYNQLERSFSDQDATVINYLAAAYAAYRIGNRQDWINCLDRAAKEYPVALSTINAMRGELLLRSNHLEQSMAVLEQLKRTSINDQHLLNLLKEVYTKLQDWQKLQELLPTLIRESVISEAEASALERRLQIEQINQCVARGKRESKPATDLADELQKFWKKVPAGIREDEAVVGAYVDALQAAGDSRQAARAIETALRRNWNDNLVDRYGSEDFSDQAQQLVHAESWLKERPNNARLLLALGRICMRNKLWGKAREYFEASRRIAPEAEVFGELSRLTRGLGELELSEEYLEKYLTLLGRTLPELPQPAGKEKQAI